MEESRKLDLRLLLRYGNIVKGSTTSGLIEWADGGWVAYTSKYTDDEKYIRLVYSLTNNTTGIQQGYNYKIQIDTIKSNLGVGEIPYLICPLTGKRAKVLVLAYGHDKYVHREAYGTVLATKPLYYRVQQVSALDYHNQRYFKLKKRIDELVARQEVRPSYGGKPSKSNIKLDRLNKKIQHHNTERNKVFVARYHSMLDRFK